MPYLVLILVTFCMASGSLLGTQYNRINVGRKGTSEIYNLVLTASALLVWATMSCFSFEFHLPTLLFSLGFGICYAFTHFGMIKAFEHGSVSMTSLMLQFSSIGTVIWGFIFWGDRISVSTVAGLMLVAIALLLCLSNQEGGKPFCWKWFLYAALMFAGNIGCSVIQKTQIRVYGEEYGNMLMVFAMLFSVIVALLFFIREDKSDVKIILKKSAILPILAGICNAALNLGVVYLAMRLSSGLVYPIIAVGGLGICIVGSLFLFHEKITRTQYVGITIGIVAVILLSL